MYEEELKGTIPNSKAYYAKRRGTLASVLEHNFRLCHLKVLTSDGNWDVQEVIDLVNVVADQAEELVEYLEGQCVTGLASSRLVIKDYAIALQAALRGLLQVDGSALGWQAVRKEVRTVADVAQKADQVIIFLEHHLDENTHDGTPFALPASLRLKKPAMKSRGARRQRSRIDDYFWESIPEVQREPMLQKKYLASLSKKEREQAVLKNMTTYKQLASDTGVIRMAKRDEIQVQETLRTVTKLQLEAHEKSRRNATYF
jgi:hypothetical protein